MISRFRRDSQIIQQESEIIQEMLAFFQENEYQSNNKEMKDKLHEYYFKIFELEVKAMEKEPCRIDAGTIDEENRDRIIYLIFESDMSNGAGNR